MSSEGVSKVAAMMPISQELLDDVPEVDFWNAVRQPPSPLEAARQAVEDAIDARDQAEADLEDALLDLAVVEATPGSDVRPPSYTVNGALAAALERVEQKP